MNRISHPLELQAAAFRVAGYIVTSQMKIMQIMTRSAMELPLAPLNAAQVVAEPQPVQAKPAKPKAPVPKRAKPVAKKRAVPPKPKAAVKAASAVKPQAAPSRAVTATPKVTPAKIVETKHVPVADPTVTTAKTTQQPPAPVRRTRAPSKPPVMPQPKAKTDP